MRISDWSSDVCSSDLADFSVFAPLNVHYPHNIPSLCLATDRPSHERKTFFFAPSCRVTWSTSTTFHTRYSRGILASSICEFLEGKCGWWQLATYYRLAYRKKPTI